MECRRGLAMRILSVCLSVRPSVKRVHVTKQNKKLRYREEHSASVVLIVGVVYDIYRRQTTDQQLINHLYETGHETYRILRNNAK